MAVPPQMPTSFVPKPSPAAMRITSGYDFGGALAFVGYGAFVIAALLAVGVFTYQWYLTNKEESKQAELAEAEAQIDRIAIDRLLRRNSRLIEGKQLLDNHIVLSQIFDPIESLIPVSVRLSSLQVTLLDGRTGTLKANGTAASLNALAVLSAELGRNGRIRDAIFADIKVEKGSVGFALSATIDPALVAFTAAGAPADTTAP